MGKEKYLNFPIHFLDGFLDNSNECLRDILNYSLYAHSINLEFNDEVSRFKSAAEFYEADLGDNPEHKHMMAENIYNSAHRNCPKVGINLSVFWDFYINYKSEFEKVCLLGFLAIKSIVQNKAYCKITNNYWLSRMDGKASSIKNKNELSDRIAKYHNEYQTKKIKRELRNNWNLKTYSRYTRGFYVSFKLPLDQLIYEAEKRRKSNIEKQYKLEEKRAIELALSRLNKKPP